MTKKKASKSSIDKKAKQPHRAPVKVAKHKVVAANNVSQKPSTGRPAPLQSSKKKKRTKKPRRSNETNPSLFGAVGKSSVKVKMIRHQQQQQQLSQTPVVAAMAAKLPKSSSGEKMNNKKKKKKAMLLITKNDASNPKNVKRKKRREGLQQQKQRKGKGETSNHHSNYQQQRGRIKIFQLPRSNESRKLSQSPWFSHSHVPPPLLSTASSPTAPNKCRLPYPFLVESMDHDAACWDWLDYELQLFAHYVRLQQVEIQARDNAISQIRNLALELFRKNVSHNNTRRSWGSSNSRKAGRFEEDQPDADDESQIRVEAFGSYAAQPVCCFQSDIDLALWGVVAPPKQPPTHFQGGGATSARVAGVDGDVANSSSPAKMDKKKRQEERIQRWKQALATLNDAKQKQQQLQDENRNENLEVAEKVDVANDAKESNPTRSEDSESSNESKEKESLTVNPPNPKRRKISASGSDRPEFFFVLDRTGVEELGGSPLPVTQSEPSDDPISNQVTAKDADVKECGLTVDLNAGNGLGNTDSANATPPSNAMGKPSNVDLFAMGIPCMDDSINNSHLDDTQPMTNDHTDTVEPEALATKTRPREDTQAKGAQKSDYVDLTRDECDFEGETIDLTFEGDSCSDRETSDSDDDSADKMSAFNPQGDLVDDDDDSVNELAAINDQREFIDSDDDSADKMSAFNRREDRDDLISLSSSTTSNSDDDELDESGLEVSFVSSARSDTSKRSNDFGPKGQMKQQVVSALVRLGNALRKRSWTHRLEIRKHARVPIINMTTATGFESDIALGGHTGVDTRLYATTLASRYESFSPVVLALKILLNQQGLDQPFTGGLGSYKLYVLVAHHLEKHLATGGSDRPGEVLVSFLFRYGVPNQVASTDLSSVMEVESHGGTADMNAVYKVEHCMELFRNCWYRLNARIREWDAEDHHEHRPSFLAPLLRAEDLQRQRNQCLQQALTWQAFADDKKGSRSKFGSPQATIPVSAAASKRKAEDSDGQRTPTDMDDAVDDETEAERLMRGYGLQRGPDGRLVPIEA